MEQEKLKNIWGHVLELMPQEAMYALAEAVHMRPPMGFQMKSLKEPQHEGRLRRQLWLCLTKGRPPRPMELLPGEDVLEGEDGSIDLTPIRDRLTGLREAGDDESIALDLSRLLLSGEEAALELAAEFGDDSPVDIKATAPALNVQVTVKDVRRVAKFGDDSADPVKLAKQVHRLEKDIKRLEGELTREREAKDNILEQKKRAAQARDELAQALEGVEQAATAAQERAESAERAVAARVGRALLAGRVFWLKGEAPAQLTSFIERALPDARAAEAAKNNIFIKLSENLTDEERIKNQLTARGAEVIYADPLAIPSGELVVLRRILKTRNLPIALVTEPLAATLKRMEELMK